MTAHPDVMECPADETLAAFIDGRLTGAERDAVIVHLAECGACRIFVQDAAELAELEKNVVRPRWGGTLGVLAAVAAALAVVFMPQIRDRFAKPDVDDLAKAFESSSVRRIQGRLSADFPHRRFDGPKRGAGDEPRPDDENLLLSSKALEIQTQNANDPHAVGVAYLMLAESENRRDNLASSIPPLRAALANADEEERTRVANDLAVALLALGAFDHQEEQFREALAVVEQELRTKRTPELLWNRALALRNLQDPRAKSAWEDYLKVDSTSAWALEARDHYLRDPAY